MDGGTTTERVYTVLFAFSGIYGVLPWGEPCGTIAPLDPSDPWALAVRTPTTMEVGHG
jgi:hypothetical protein